MKRKIVKIVKARRWDTEPMTLAKSSESSKTVLKEFSGERLEQGFGNQLNFAVEIDPAGLS